jgi:hypothetical protein
MRPRGENVHYDDLLDRHEIVVAAKRKLDAQVVTLAAELGASETRIEAMKAINTGLEAVCRRYEAALKDISIWQNDLTSARAVAIWALGSQTETKAEPNSGTFENGPYGVRVETGCICGATTADTHRRDCRFWKETACGEKPPIGFGVPTLADRVKEIMKETGATFECALQTTAHECELRSEAIFAVRQYFDHYEPEVNR